MNEHLAETAAHIRTEAGNLTAIAEMLETWKAALDMRSVNPVLQTPAPVVTIEQMRTALDLAGGKQPPGAPQRKESDAHVHRKPRGQRDPGSTIEGLVISAIEGLSNPFTLVHVRDAAATLNPSKEKLIRKDANVGYYMMKLRERGWLECVGGRRGNRPMLYGRTKAWGGLTPKESAYRELRATIKTSTPEGE